MLRAGGRREGGTKEGWVLAEALRAVVRPQRQRWGMEASLPGVSGVQSSCPARGCGVGPGPGVGGRHGGGPGRNCPHGRGSTGPAPRRPAEGPPHPTQGPTGEGGAAPHGPPLAPEHCLPHSAPDRERGVICARRCPIRAGAELSPLPLSTNRKQRGAGPEKAGHPTGSILRAQLPFLFWLWSRLLPLLRVLMGCACCLRSCSKADWTALLPARPAYIRVSEARWRRCWAAIVVGKRGASRQPVRADGGRWGPGGGRGVPLGMAGERLGVAQSPL